MSALKIALFTNVEERAVISLKDVSSIYQIPALLKSQGLDDLVVRRFHMTCPEADLTEWEQVLYQESNPTGEVTIGMVGKYVELPDAYKSVNEALNHAGLKNRLTVHIKYIDSQDVESKGTDILAGLWMRFWCLVVLVSVAWKAKLLAAHYARKTKSLTSVFV